MIEKELDKICSVSAGIEKEISREKAFDYLICSLYCLNSTDYHRNYYDLTNEHISDGSYDGGIDFIYFDDDESKIIIGQNKLSKNIKVKDAVAEVNKVINTLEDFSKNNTSKYNKNLKRMLRNALDRLSEENEGNIEILFSSLSTFNESSVRNSLVNNTSLLFSEITFINENEIIKLLDSINENLEVIPEFKFYIDKSQNILQYESEKYEGILVNINAKSLKEAFEKYEAEGLFNLNIRRYIKSKSVDDAIVNSIRKNPSDFWFLNNGITIACKDFHIDGDNIKVYDFSIVNGGQTTTLIANELNNNDDMFLMSKIIKNTEDLDTLESMRFFNNIAEATNSQKPIQPKDLKSNAPEMVDLHRLLLDRNIFFEIKRGISAPRNFDRKINNEQFAQIFNSFVHQRPGTSRSNKRSLFSNNNHYKSIFFNNFRKDTAKADFIDDLINLNKRVDIEIQKIKERKEIDQKQMIILSNAKQHIVAIIGYIYRIVNKDLNIKKNFELSGRDFVYGTFISNYKHDNIDNKINDLILEIVDQLNTTYDIEFEKGLVTSPSNFFKTDKKYIDTIINNYTGHLKLRNFEQELINYYGDLLKREL